MNANLIKILSNFYKTKPSESFNKKDKQQIHENFNESDKLYIELINEEKYGYITRK